MATSAILIEKPAAVKNWAFDNENVFFHNCVGDDMYNAYIYNYIYIYIYIYIHISYSYIYTYCTFNNH